MRIRVVVVSVPFVCFTHKCFPPYRPVAHRNFWVGGLELCRVFNRAPRGTEAGGGVKPNLHV